MNPTPTTRFVIEPSLVCQIKCKFCYHLHRYSEWKDTVKSIEQVRAEIDAGIARGNDYADFTGGEPTIYPHIKEAIEYALSKGVRSCVITNGIVIPKIADGIMAAGVDDWLVSRHGLEKTHDFVTNYPGAYRHQVRFLERVTERMSVRFNCVLHRYNQGEILEIAREMAEFKPRIVNFINMNPHHEWKAKELETKEVIADLSVVQPLLDAALDLLESQGIGVNVRYYPMCALSEQHRRCVCNDLHVMFDPYEWDYATTPKTVERYREWGQGTSRCVENQGEPCSLCAIKAACGGVNKAYFKASDGRHIRAQLEPKINDFYHYRKDNAMTLGVK